MKEKRRFLFQGLLLTAVSLLLRAVGVGAQAYISSRIGAEAVGVSSLIGSVGGFAITLALSGLHLGCTRLVSEGLVNHDSRFIRRSLGCAIIHAMLFGTLSCVLLFSTSRTIATFWLRDLRVVPSLRLLALTLPGIAISSCISGYFVAVRRVWKSAFVQVGEEVVRLACTVILLQRMAENGLQAALLALAIANAVADISACLLLLLLCRHDVRRHIPRCVNANSRGDSVVRQLLSITLPVATAAYARSGLITLEHMLIPVGLKRAGIEHSVAMASYGALHSMALPVVLFPCALLGAFSGLLIPEITQAHVRRESAHIRSMMQRVFLLTLIFSIGVAGIILCFSRELGLLLYGNEQAALYIRVLAPLVPVMYMDSATDAMLKGLGQQVYSMNVNIVDASLSVLLVWLLMPGMGIWGYVATIYFTELLNAALSIARLLTIGELRPRLGQWIVKPLAAIVTATIVSRWFITATDAVVSPFVLILSITGCAMVYGLLILMLGAIKRDELRWLSDFARADAPT